MDRAVTSHPPGSVCWVDLGTPQPELAALFYAALFGWHISDPDDQGYRLARLAGRTVAGLGPGGSTPYWTVNVAVTNIDQASERCEAAGGELVVAPSSAGPAGRFAVTRSPNGLSLSLWESGTQTGMQTGGEPGSFAHVELSSLTPADDVEFLSRSLGWRLTEEGVLSSRGRPVARVSDSSVPAAGRPRWIVCFAVHEIETLALRAQALGGRTGRAGGLGPGPRIRLLADDQGAEFALTVAD